MKQLLILVIIVLTVSACSNNESLPPLKEMSSLQLFNKYRKSVVMIKNRSYYKIQFSNNTEAYMNLDNELDGGYITFNKQEAEENATVGYGTGFFVGEKGIIATNFHVIAPVSDLVENSNFTKEVIETIHLTRDNILSNLEWEASQYLTQYNDTAYLHAAIPDNIFNTLTIKVSDQKPEDSANVYKQRIDSLVNAFNNIHQIETTDFKLTIETAELSIVMDAVTGNSKAYPCHIYSLTQDNKADLALIQTDDEKIPEGAECGINMYESDSTVYHMTMFEWDTLKVTTPLYLISFNHGEEIARTSQGIKVQLTQGSVSQESDQYRVLYSIPVLPGSSGGPVFNKKGQLVAINYCGFIAKDDFNYGVLSHQLIKLIQSPPETEVKL